MKLLSYDDLKARGVTYSRAHLWRLMRARKFPQAVKLSANGVNHWREDELDAFLEQRSAERDQVGPFPKKGI